MHYEYINKYGILQNKKVLGHEVDDELRRVENELYQRSAPRVYGGEKGSIIKEEKDFENSCILLQQKGILSPKKLNVLEFYQAIVLIDKQNNHGKPKRNKKS